MLKQKEVIAVELDNRKFQILTAIVDEYIKFGEPVGSKTLSQLINIPVSPATVRNDMAALFEMGLLEQPHTSAGRIPSHLGYRIYVDNLMRHNSIDSDDKKEIDALFNVMNPDPDRLLCDAAEAIAKFTGCASISSSITPKNVYVKKIELIKATNNAVLILLIASNGAIKNKLCRVDFYLNDKLCEFFTSFANGRLAGKTLDEISSQYIKSMAVSLGEYSSIFNPLLAAVYSLCEELERGQFYVKGETNLLAYKDLEKGVLDILLMLTQKEEVLRITEQGESDITIFIGKENSHCELNNSSVLISKYKIGDYSEGILALVGPVRMDYAKTISNLEYFSNTLAQLLSDIVEKNIE